MSLASFVERHKDAICAAVVDAFPPRYDAPARSDPSFSLGHLVRKPIGGQSDAVRATALSLLTHRGTVVVGEQGSGKTFIAAAASSAARFERVLVMAPPHLVSKWEREVKKTVPGARTAIVRTLADLDRVVRANPRRKGPRRSQAANPLYVVLSRERAKLGYRWKPCFVRRWARDDEGGLRHDEGGAATQTLCCPTCFAPLLDDEGVPTEESSLAEKRRTCPACRGPLWSADRRGPRRYPLADYLRRRHRGYFQLFVADEVHELKGRGSAQGVAAASLADACERTLALTGTVFGGYSSTLFHLLRRFSPNVRLEFGHRDEPRWVSRYGIVHRITKRSPDAYSEDGRQSKRRNYTTRIVEKPGIAPAVLFHLLPNTVFLRLSDVDHHLPPYTERVALFPLDGTAQRDASQQSAYRKIAGALLAAVRGALAKGSKRLLAVYLQTLLSYPDGCTHAETVLDKRTGSVIAAAPALSPDVVYPKERALLDLVRRQRRQRRRVVIYVANTDTRDITPRLKLLLEREGARVAVLKAHTVKPERREAWLARQVEEGADVLLCHPKLVQTGLDLLDWATYVFYQVEYSVYVMRQASRRGWRIGQTQPVEVVHFAYEGTLQAEALALVAAKLRAAVLLDGEMPEDGLAALDDDGKDLFLALARRLAADAPSDASSLEALFARAQQARAEDDDFLADGEWSASVGPTGRTPLLPHKGTGPEAVGVPTTDTAGARLPAGTSGAPGRRSTQLRLDPEAPGTAPPPDDPVVARGRLLTFAELSTLVRTPHRRAKAAPAGQLPLLAA